MLIYRLSEIRQLATILTKEEGFSTTNCKHSLKFMCHAHKGNATEMTKIQVGTKHGLWNLDWTMDWTMDWIMDSILGLILDWTSEPTNLTFLFLVHLPVFDHFQH